VRRKRGLLLDFEDTFEMLDFSNAENQKKSKNYFFFSRLRETLLHRQEEAAVGVRTCCNWLLYLYFFEKE